MSAPPTADQRRRVPAAQEAALSGIQVVVSRHLAHEAAARRDDGPQVVLVDGRFGSEFVDRVASGLRDAPPAIGTDEPQPWSVVRFDAWQYQRLEPPWWWLITAIDRELQAAREPGERARSRARDYLWRAGHMLADMALWIVVASVLVGAWLLLGRPAMDETAKWLSAAVGAASVAALVWSGFNAVRSRLLLANPVNAQATLRTKDPMARLRQRYEFLVRSANGPVIVVVDNLDRCSADYVVDLLEGIHTLLKPPPGTGADANFVCFVVPADRAWLCDSFMQRYAAFKEAISEPGRPFGLSFVDKVFDVMLCLPRISPDCARMPEKVPAGIRRAIRNISQEMEIRRIVHDAEQGFADDQVTPVSSLRIDAVVQIGKTEAADECDHACSDTKRMLDELSDTVDVGPVLMNQLRDAYCVHRTAQFLGGHEIDVEDGALMRLGRWTVLDFRWPLLTAYLREHPEAIEDLQQGMAPADLDEDLRPLFARGDPSEIARGLTAETVRRFTQPLSVRDAAALT